jgi:transposase-like protein
MARKVIAMQTKLAVAVAMWASGEKINVTALAEEFGISRQSVYKYRARFVAEGVAGLAERSRRPHSCPWRTSTEVEDEIVRQRKQLAETGWDNGAVSVFYAMLDAGGPRPPSVATINRVLRRRGLVVDQPAKRPRSANRRFEFAAANGCWQIDAFDYRLADGSPAVVYQIIDDHSREEMDSYAARSENAEDAWACWLRALQRHGVPVMLLSDNSTAFSGARRGWTSQFERNVRTLGTATITCTPAHPQTCGKDERCHQTLQKWLQAQPRAQTIQQLQELLDQWRPKYGQRRHQGINGQKPAERWAVADKAAPDTVPAAEPTVITHPKADRGGKVSVDGHTVCLGSQYAHASFTVMRAGDHVAIFHTNTLIRDLTLDRNHRYQPSGTKPGGKYRRRIDPAARVRTSHRSPTAKPADDEEDVKMQRPQRSEDERP